MQVVVAQTCGFCRGVKNAINTAKNTLETTDNVYCLGHIIHNEDVVNQLADNGMKCVESLDQVDAGTVLIRSHGATRKEIEKIRQKGLDIVDATCVLVKRVQKIAAQLSDEGYFTVIVGDENHPEVIAIAGSADGITVVNGKEDLHKIPQHKKLGLICQTTQSPEHFAEMIREIALIPFVEIKIINTLCKEAIKRQKSAVDLCKKVDIMFVLGGLTSANTCKLAELCREYNSQTYHLQNVTELDESCLKGKKTAGITAGASTPDWVIEEFIKHLEKV